MARERQPEPSKEELLDPSEAVSAEENPIHDATEWFAHVANKNEEEALFTEQREDPYMQADTARVNAELDAMESARTKIQSSVGSSSSFRESTPKFSPKQKKVPPQKKPGFWSRLFGGLFSPRQKKVK